MKSNMAALNNKRLAKRKFATGNFKRVTANSSLLGYLLLGPSIHQCPKTMWWHTGKTVWLLLWVFQRCYLSQPDVCLTINYSKKTIPSLSAYYFHLVTSMFKVTVNVSVILNVKLQKNCICVHSRHQIFKIMFYLFVVELLQGAHNFKIYPFLIFFGLLYIWNVLHCSVHM